MNRRARWRNRPLLTDEQILDRLADIPRRDWVKVRNVGREAAAWLESRLDGRGSSYVAQRIERYAGPQA
jgi:hypothetical protein